MSSPEVVHSMVSQCASGAAVIASAKVVSARGYFAVYAACCLLSQHAPGPPGRYSKFAILRRPLCWSPGGECLDALRPPPQLEHLAVQHDLRVVPAGIGHAELALFFVTNA